MSLIRYSSNLSPVRRVGIESFFDDFMDIFDVLDPMVRRPALVGPRTSVENLDDKHVITMATPGISRDDLKVDVADGRLTVSYDEDNSENSFFEFQNSFEKSWSLGDNIDLDSIKADYSDGVLTVEIPKSEKVVPAARRIGIS